MSDRYLPILYDWWCRDWLRSRVVKVSLLFVAITYFGLEAWNGTGPNTAYGIDLFHFLDAGWRVLQGQIPYRDFYLSLGPLEPYAEALAMKLTGASPESLALAQLLLAAIVVPWGFALARSRMNAVPAILITVWLIITGFSATPLGTSSLDISFAMPYNRHSYALLGILLIECLLIPAAASLWSGVSSGVALALLLCVKLNFFGIGAAFVGLSVVCYPTLRARLVGIVAGFGAVSLFFAALIRFSLPQMASDMVMTIRARSATVATGSLSRDLLRPETTVLVMFTIACAFLLIRDGSLILGVLRSVVPVGLVVGAGLVLIRTNGEELYFPLHVCWILILLGAITRSSTADSTDRQRLPLMVIVGLGLLVSPFVRAGFATANWLKYAVTPQLSHGGFHLNAPGLEKLRFFDAGTGLDAEENGHLLVDFVDDGLDLVRANSASSDKVLTLGHINPFSYCLRRPPAKGGSLWLNVANVSENVRPPAERIFGDADVVMIPDWLRSHEKGQEFIERLYAPYIAQHYELKAKSKWWTLYRRR